MKMAPEAVWVLVKMHYGISEVHWTKLGLKTTLVVVLLLVPVLQKNVKVYALVKVHYGISEGHIIGPN